MFKKYIAIKNVIPVIKVKGIALEINFLKPNLKDLSSSYINPKECLIECRKQKYVVNAKIGVKKKFKIIIDRKSNIKITLKLNSFLNEI